MFKSLSKSTTIMLCFDLFVLIVSADFWYKQFNLPDNYLYQATLLLLASSGIFVNCLKGYYKIREFNINKKNAYLLFEACVLAHLPVLIILLFFLNNITSSLKFIGVNLLTVFLSFFIYRILFHIYLFNFKHIKNILIVGTDKNARIMADEIINKQALRMNIAGFLEDFQDEDGVIGDGQFEIYKQPADLKTIVKEKKIDIVVVAINRRIEETLLIQMVNSIPRNVKLYTMPEFYEMVTGKVYIDEMSANGLFFNFMKRRSVFYDSAKRLFDIISSLIILTVTLPITSYIAFRVWLIDKHSPFYTQTRVGKDGKTFECYKLRTMYINDYVPKSAEDIKYAESIKSDDRIIPFCRFVRKARFDEIPQMINILKGEMSIVGPRAEWVNETVVFEKEIPFYKMRNIVRAGWTGWSHISMGPCFTVEDEKERLSYDLYYIKNRNVFWEISILVKAVFLALGGRHK